MTLARKRRSYTVGCHVIMNILSETKDEDNEFGEFCKFSSRLLKFNIESNLNVFKKRAVVLSF